MPPTGERLGLPAAGKCLLCHQNMAKTTAALRLLVQTPKDAVPFKVTSHRLPDFVTFSHATHAGAGVACPAATQARTRTTFPSRAPC